MLYLVDLDEFKSQGTTVAFTCRGQEWESCNEINRKKIVVACRNTVDFPHIFCPVTGGLGCDAGADCGYRLSNVHVGDTLQFFTIGSSDVDASEYLTAFPAVHFFASADNFDVFSGVGLAGWNSPLGSNPHLALWTVRLSAAGTVDLFNGFPDCVGLPGDMTGCAMTNLGATRPADSNRVTFTVFAVPEPSSIALLAVGFLALGLCRRKI